MKKVIIFIIIIMAFYLYSQYKPISAHIVNNTTLEEGRGNILYKGEKYEASFTETKKYNGHVRLKVRVYNRSFPFLTHDVVLATGDFKDPSKVKIESLGKGNYVWSSKEKPEGTIIFLHVIPGSINALKTLEKATIGQQIVLEGKIDKNSTITNSKGNWIQLGHANHKFLFLKHIKLNPV